MKTIDTRDLLKRLNELQDLKSNLEAAREEREQIGGETSSTQEQIDEADEAVQAAEAEFSFDDEEELKELETLESEISDFRYGETMIPEGDFTNYAMQLAEDIGAIPSDAQWPCTCIDWEQAAEELAQDYTTVTYQGEDYLVRA